MAGPDECDREAARVIEHVQAAAGLALIAALVAAPRDADAVLLVPVAPSVTHAAAFDLIVRSEARVLTPGPIARSIVATNTQRLRNQALGAGFIAVGWDNAACEGGS